MSMMTRVVLSVLVTVSMGAVQAQSPQPSAAQHRFNRAPLRPKPYAELPLGQVRAEGWLQHQLELMAQGMTGDLDRLYSSVAGPRNGWLGGDGDGWERGPYWIDGLLPLAHLLDDQKLKDKVAPWVEWTLSNQMADGYLGPIPFETKPADEPGLQKTPRRDWWPKMVMLKILQNHYSATGDVRVITVLDRYFRYQLRELPEKPLGHWTFWGNRRGGDNLAVVLWLYNITGEKYLLELADLIHQQTYDHTGEWLKEASPLTRQKGMHCVNIAQGMKHPVIYSQVDGDAVHLRAVRKALSDLDQYFGHPTGLYGADEPLNSKRPTTGSEFCTAVEMLYSLEKIAEITGDVPLLDRLERIAFNVLPTQATDDFSGKQYYSLVNQVHAARRQQRAHLTDHRGTDNVFGLLTGYPCCTTNFHQGWPKFTQHLWMASADGGLAALYYAPCRVKTELDGRKVAIQENTDYPFEDIIRFAMTLDQPLSFPFHLRIPGWCESATVSINGKTERTAAGGQIIQVNRLWKSGDVVELQLPARLVASRWYADAATIERGSLVFGLRIGESWQRVTNTDDSYGDYTECHPTTPWNYGLFAGDLKNLADRFQLHRREGQLADNPWNLENAPLELRGNGQRIPQWEAENQTAGRLSPSPVKVDQIAPEPIKLIPYGCTTLRIAEFPVIAEHPDLAGATAWRSYKTQKLYTATASHVWGGDSVEAIADGLEPERSADTTIPRMTFWDHRGTQEWLQATMDQSRTIDAAAVYWFDDTGSGACRVPSSWRLMYQVGDAWKPVEEVESPFGVEADRFNVVMFKPVETKALRLEMKLKEGFSAGVLEWRVYKSSR